MTATPAPYDLLHFIAGAEYLRAVKRGDTARAERAASIKRAAFERGMLKNTRRRGAATVTYVNRAHATIQGHLRRAALVRQVAA